MVKRRRIRPASARDSISPLKLCTQIISVQLIYYFAATILILFTAAVAGQAFSLDLVFSWHSLRGDNTVGWTLGLVWMMTCLVMVLAITILIGRTKFVLDFSLTLHFLHLIVTTLYTHSLPWTWLWWALQTSSAIVMVCLATWTCEWREMQPIAWKGGGGGGGSTSNIRDVESGSSMEMARLKQEP